MGRQVEIIYDGKFHGIRFLTQCQRKNVTFLKVTECTDSGTEDIKIKYLVKFLVEGFLFLTVIRVISNVIN